MKGFIKIGNSLYNLDEIVYINWRDSNTTTTVVLKNGTEVKETGVNFTELAKTLSK